MYNLSKILKKSIYWRNFQLSQCFFSSANYYIIMLSRRHFIRYQFDCVCVYVSACCTCIACNVIACTFACPFPPLKHAEQKVQKTNDGDQYALHRTGYIVNEELGKEIVDAHKLDGSTRERSTQQLPCWSVTSCSLLWDTHGLPSLSILIKTLGQYRSLNKEHTHTREMIIKEV